MPPKKNLKLSFVRRSRTAQNRKRTRRKTSARTIFCKSRKEIFFILIFMNRKVFVNIVIIIGIIIVAVIAGYFALNQRTTPTPSSETKTVSLGEEFTLKKGETPRV